MKQKTVQKLTALLLGAILCAAACLSVFAAGKTYTVKELSDLEVTLPDNMMAVTRSSQQDDPYFSLHNLDYNEVMADFHNGQIYLQAMDNVEAITLTLSCLETEQSKSIGDYIKLSATEMEKVAQTFITESGAEAQFNSSTVDEAKKGVVWLYFNLTAKNNGSSFRQYQATTVHNGKSYSLTLYRNGGNVTAEDYAVLQGIVATVKFGDTQKPFIGSMMFYLIIGGAVLLIIILLIVILVAVSKAKKRKKKNQNDKILKELAGKYTTNRPSGLPQTDGYDGGYGDDFADEDEALAYRSDAEEEATAQPEQEAPAAAPDYDFDEFDEDYDASERKYSDEDIARLLGDIEDDENFIDALPDTQADSEADSEVRDSVLDDTDSISAYFEDGEAPVAPNPAAEDAVSAYPVEEFAEAFDMSEADDDAEDEGDDASADEEVEGPSFDTMNISHITISPKSAAILAELEGEDMPQEESPAEEPATAEEPAEAFAETDEPAEDGVPAEEPEEAEAFVPDDAEMEEPDGKETDESEGSEETDEAEEEFREFVNDEVLAREESNQDRFKDSSDFFEEAPRKVMGVISSKEIEEAEEYDVIGEVEQRAEELEKETPTAGESFSRAMKKIGSGCKSFFTHCGYFVTNVKREIKRSRARKKRQKAEEQRRQAQAERRRQARPAREVRRDENGLVQVHHRSESRKR